MEPIEQWKEEFCRELSIPSETKYHPLFGFEDQLFNLLWKGFKAAKRSQPVVELPKPEMCFGKRPFAYVQLDPLTECLKSAGIQYRIKGE